MTKYLFAATLAAGTGLAWAAGVRGVGLPSSVSRPVSVRQYSVHRRSAGWWIISRRGYGYRSHSGGGWGFGK